MSLIARHCSLVCTQYYSPTSNSVEEVFLEKLIVTQLVMNFTYFYGTPSFITMLTTARQWTLSLARIV
jgi:hypothetical protein